MTVSVMKLSALLLSLLIPVILGNDARSPSANHENVQLLSLTSPGHAWRVVSFDGRE